MRPLGFILFLSVLLACGKDKNLPPAPSFWLFVRGCRKWLLHCNIPHWCVWGGGGEQQLYVTLNFEAMTLRSERPATATNQTPFPTRSALKKYIPQLSAAESCFLTRPVKQFLNGEKTLNEALLQVLFNNDSMPVEGHRGNLLLCCTSRLLSFSKGRGTASGLPSPKAQGGCWTCRAPPAAAPAQRPRSPGKGFPVPSPKGTGEHPSSLKEKKGVGFPLKEKNRDL